MVMRIRACFLVSLVEILRPWFVTNQARTESRVENVRGAEHLRELSGIIAPDESDFHPAHQPRPGESHVVPNFMRGDTGTVVEHPSVDDERGANGDSLQW